MAGASWAAPLLFSAQPAESFAMLALHEVATRDLPAQQVALHGSGRLRQRQRKRRRERIGQRQRHDVTAHAEPAVADALALEERAYRISKDVWGRTSPAQPSTS